MALLSCGLPYQHHKKGKHENHLTNSCALHPGAACCVPLSTDSGIVKPDSTFNVVNQSSREGARPKLIFLHTWEGGSLSGVVDEFNNSSSQASAHIVISKDATVVRCVSDNMKAWTECEYNRLSLSIEQEGFSADSKEVWFKEHSKQLSKVAAQCAEWSVKFDIPLRKGFIGGTTVVIRRTGIVQHKDAGIVGCGHSDCGPGYPQGYVTKLARLIVEEHHLGRPTGKTASRLRRSLNRQRRRYGLPEFAAPPISIHRSSGTKSA